MKKLTILLAVFFLASCVGFKNEGKSVVKEEKEQPVVNLVNNKTTEDIEIQEDQAKKIEETENSEEINYTKEVKTEKMEDILALEEEKQEVVFEKPREWKVIKTFDNQITSKEYIKYKGILPEKLNYVIVLSPRINLREKPSTESEVILSASQGERLEVLELVEAKDGDQWYKIRKKDEELFVNNKIVTLREFRFEKAEEKIVELEKFLQAAKEKEKSISVISAYRPNPNNVNLLRGKDKYGNVKDQSAVGYYEKNKVYIPDGTIVAIEEELNGNYRVKKQEGDEPYLDVSKHSVNKDIRINEMPNKVVVIDIRNQNFTVYEKILGEWNIISYVYSKTGSESKLGFKTPRGNFMVLAAKKIMTYNDSRGREQGYANHAIRFSGGGYIHGIPFNLKEKGEIEKYRKERENSLGSYPGTRKCVRNSVDHARFLFDWVVGEEQKEGNFQGIEENVAVIVM